MKSIAVYGSESFVLGFQLAGIRIVHKTSSDVLDEIAQIQTNKDIGIVIVEEQLLKGLEVQQRLEIEDAINPVFIALSTEHSADNIRKLIMRSIGVDVYKD